jgi:hypothetical protein
MLQAYLSQLILKYAKLYIQNIEADLQLSLWGGDVVLNNLELRLSGLFLVSLSHPPATFQSDLLYHSLTRRTFYSYWARTHPRLHQRVRFFGELWKFQTLGPQHLSTQIANSRPLDSTNQPLSRGKSA